MPIDEQPPQPEEQPAPPEEPCSAPPPLPRSRNIVIRSRRHIQPTNRLRNWVRIAAIAAAATGAVLVGRQIAKNPAQTDDAQTETDWGAKQRAADFERQKAREAEHPGLEIKLTGTIKRRGNEPIIKLNPTSRPVELGAVRIFYDGSRITVKAIVIVKTPHKTYEYLLQPISIDRADGEEMERPFEVTGALIPF